jgi:predicted outer membrane protein
MVRAHPPQELSPTKTSFVALSLLTVALATSCDRRDDPGNAPTPDAAVSDTAPVPATDPTASVPAAADGDAASPAATPATDDALALGLLAAVDDHEIQAAQQAMSKKVSAPVMDYARMMEKQHTDNLVETKALGALADTPEVQAMKEKAASDLAELGKKSGKDYESAYVAAMVSGHTEALALIDGRLLALASPGPVRDHFSKTREHVAMHLEAAQKLQAGSPATP